MQQKYQDILAIFDTDTSDINLQDVFTSEEIELIDAKINEFTINPKSRSGGSKLQVEVAAFNEFQQKNNFVLMMRHAEVIDNVLYSTRKERTTESKKLEAIVKVTAESYVRLDEKTLRKMGEVILGDKQVDFTVEELPYALAYMQIKNESKEPGEVLR
jgi:hypothetical protein